MTIDAVSEWLLARGFAWLVGAVCVALLATWVPHYVTWPWFRDLDAFATIAQSWDAGILPYRDIRAYNFPGQIYILWILGRTVGWGHTAAFYFVDVGFLLILGAALILWSRRLVTGLTPDNPAMVGLIAYLLFLTQYLNLEYSQIAQRDWQATCLVVLALLALQASHGRAARAMSALLTAFALAFRPHVVLFLPAIVSAIDENVERARPTGSASRTGGAVVEWSMTFSIGVVAAFAPLILAGVAPDFVRGVRVAAYGGPYSQNSVGVAAQAFVEELTTGWTPYVVAVGPLLWIAGPPPLRRVGRTWSLAMLGALLYKPLHPVQHSYLFRPLELISAVLAGLGVAWILSLRSLARPVTLLMVVAIASAGFTHIPQYCSVRESVRAFGPLFRGEEPMQPPLGSRQWLRSTDDDDSAYRWSDYRDVVVYLRGNTAAETVVANVLRRFPFPPVNAPAGRLSPFLAESGICWMWLVDEDLDVVFADSLARATDSVVVWSPNETGVERRMRLPAVTAVIHRFYQVEARMGRIEIWRRAGGPPAIRPAEQQ